MAENTKISEPMLSTIDNPFNPFTDFDKWNQYDQAKGYFTLSYLARVVDYQNCITEEHRQNAREKAIDEILTLNPVKIYCKVYANETIVPMQL